MAKINLYSDKQVSATSVSNIFIDEYMSDANGEFVKIYLYLLRQLNSSDAKFSISEIADKFEHTEKDIKRALNYWERMQLLHLEYDGDENLTGIQLLDAQSKGPVAPAAATTAVVEVPKAASTVSDTPKKKSYSPDELKKFREQESVEELLFIAEQYLGRTLTVSDLNAIIYWFDELKFSPELIEYLIEYCVSKGHSSIRYIEKVALAWAENNCRTVEEAKLMNGQFNQSYHTVMKAMGITGRNLASSETAYIDKWKNDYGFSIQLIQTACEKTIQAIHEPSFEYADRILSNWKSNGVSTLEDVAKADSAHQKRQKAATTVSRTAHKNKFNNFDQRSYDYDQLEKMLLTTSVH